MLLSQLNNLFNKTISLEQFLKEIEFEISNYKKGMEKMGGSNPIFLKEDISHLCVNEKTIEILCSAYLKNNLNKWELNYIAEALLLSEKIDISNNKVKDALLGLTDAEYYTIVNREFIRDILNDLNSNSTFDL